MLLEVNRVKNLPVIDAEQNRLGIADSLFFEGERGSVIGLKVLKDGLMKKFAALDYRDCDISSQQVVAIEDQSELSDQLGSFNEAVKKYGKVIGIKAVTETGNGLGKIEDVIFEAETGLIVRFVLRNYLIERIIPRQFLVSITPKQVIFQDTVLTPTFDKQASGELVATPKT